MERPVYHRGAFNGEGLLSRGEFNGEGRLS